jgi:hypothetical protein
MNTILINVSFFDVFETGLKVIRVEYDDDYTKIDLGFLYGEKRKNSIKITEDIIISDYNTKKGLIECIGINLNEEVKLKSIKDFRYFSLKFEPFESVKKQLMLTQYNDDFNFIILDITKAKS